MKRKVFIILCSFFIYSFSIAQQNVVNKFIYEIESAVNTVNSKAQAKDIEGALEELRKLNTHIGRCELSFHEEYATAREEKGNLNFTLKPTLVTQMNAKYWEEMLGKFDKIKKGYKEALQGIEYERQLDSQDASWAYITTIYNAGKSIKNMAEKTSEKAWLGFFFSTQDGIDQFLVDYKKILSAENQKNETDAKEGEIKRLLSKAKQMERNYTVLEEKIRKGFGVVQEFNEKISALNQIANNIDKEPRFKIDPTDSRYIFNSSKYLQQIKSEADRLESGYIKWENFSETYKSVMNRASQEMQKVISELKKSDDYAVKESRLREVEDQYIAFENETNFRIRELESKNKKEDGLEGLNLNSRLSGYEPLQAPTNQNFDSGSSGNEIRLSQVKAEADVQELVNVIHLGVKEINQLANQKQMKVAINRLSDLNRRIESDLNFSFGKNYALAREENPDFIIQVNAQLSGQFKSAYWESNLKKTAAKYNDLSNKFYSLPKGNARIYWRRVYEICKAAYDMSQIKSNVEKELKENGKQEAYDKLKGELDGINSGFKKIDEAFKVPENIPLQKDDIEKLMVKVKQTSNILEEMASYMNANEEEATYFYSLIDRLNKIKKGVEMGPQKVIDNFSDSRYNFDESAFYIELEVLVSDYKEEEISWNQFDQNCNALIKKAENSKYQVIENIKGTDDTDDKKKQAINTETNDWVNFDDYAKRKRDELFDLKDQSTSPEYSWNSQSSLNKINKLKSDFKAGDFDYESLEIQIKQVIEDAENNKIEVSNNIYALNAPDKFDKANQLEKDFDDFNNLAYDVMDECSAFQKNKAANPFENMQAESGVSQQNTDNTNISQQQENADSNFGDTPFGPSGKRIKNIFYHNIWRRKSGSKVIFKQNGTSVMWGNKSGEIKNGVLTYHFTDSDNVPYKVEFKLLGDGYKIEVRKEMTDRLISDYLFILNNGYAPKQDKIDEYRTKNGSVKVSELEYMGSFLAMTNDSDRDAVRDDFDNCLNTPKGLTVTNGGVNIMGCPTGQTPNQQTNTASTENNNKEVSENPFNSSTSSLSQQTNSSYQQNNSFNSNVTKPKNEKPYSEPVGKVGIVGNDGNGDGKYCSLAVEKINDSDILGFSLLSGIMVYVQVIYRDETGYWRTKYEGNRTKFKASEFLKDIPGNITHLNFIVNSDHNHFKRGTKPCEMEIWHLPANGRIPTHNVATQTAQTNNNIADSKISKDFDALIEKANQAFDKKYWEDENTHKTTINPTNPKQESLNYLRQAEPIISRQTNLITRYSMVSHLASVSSSYAKRVFVNTAKVDFIKLAGKLLSRYSGAISSITKEVNGMSAPKARSMAYSNVAEAWRGLAQAALWGNGQFNKMYCDKESKKYYERALQEDRKNIELQKTVEKINAPKKPIPAAVKKFKEIKPDTWNEAQTLMTQLENDILERESQPTEIHPMEIGHMTLEFSSGTVSIMRSGSKNWQKVTVDSYNLIFVGDKIKTSHDAKGVSITFTSDRTFLAIKNNAEIEFWSDSKLLIKRGGASIVVTKKGSKFLVITPTCAVGVRGTKFEVNVKDDKTTETYLYEGVVETRNGSDIAYLVPGQKMIAKKGEAKLQQSNFNAQQRLATHWRGFEQQKRKHEQIVTNNKSSQPKKKINPTNKKKTITKPKNNNLKSNNKSFAEFWSLNTYNNNIESFKQNVTTKTNKGFVPVGLNCMNSQYEVLYLGGGVLSITAWNMEWYNDANSLQQGINKNMNQGYIPSGFSWDGKAYYVFYIKTNFNGKAWQIVPSALDLNAVSIAIKPFVDQKYTPMGITIFGDEYYTLLVQFDTPLANNWFIEGYNDKRSEIVKNINKKLPDGTVPWGILKSSGVANILYIGI